MTTLIERGRMALAVLRGNATIGRMSGGGKSAPFTFPAWVDGNPQWVMGDFMTYVSEGYDLNSLIFSAVAYKERAIGSVPLLAYKGSPDNPERLPPTHPLAMLAARPNPFQSWREFQRQRVAYLNLSGNSFTYVDRPSRNAPPVALYNLRPDRVYVIPGKNSLRGYLYKPEEKGIRDGFAILPQDMMHVKFTNPKDPYEGFGAGLSPLAPLAQSADVDNNITKYLKLLFERGTMLSGMLTFKMPLDDAQIARIRSRWKDIYGGVENWDEIGIMDSEASYQKLGMTFEELGFESLDERNETRILGPFGVPPILLGTRTGLARSTMSNYAEARRQCWEDTLLPEIELFGDEDRYFLQTDDGAWVAYDLSRVPALQKDLPKLVDTAFRMWSMGVPANIAFREVGLMLPPLPGGDVSYLPTSVIPAGAAADTTSTADGSTTAATEDTRKAKAADEEPGWSDEEKAVIWKALDDIAVSYEDEFRAGAAAAFEVDKREILALVGEAKARSLLQKATIQWQMVFDDVLTYLRDKAGENWRQTFTPLISGAVKGTASYWNVQAGLAFDVRNLNAEEWFINYMLKFADPITATSEREIAGIIQLGIQEGWSIPEMQNALEKMFTQWIGGNVTDWNFADVRLPPWRAELIARTETTRATNAGSFQIYKANNVKEKEWLSTQDDRVRDSHKNANRQVRAIDTPFDIGTSKMMYPGDASLGAPLAEFGNCRCTVLPRLKEKDA